MAVDRVREELSPGFELNTELFSQFETHELISFKIDDPKRLDRYVAEKEVELAEVRKESSHNSFILDAEANLFLSGSELLPYQIERGSLRHRLIFYLAKNGGYMSAAELAEKIGTNPKRIRTTVGQLRDKAKEKFGVPGTDLIQSRDTGSYRAISIKLKVPKGYTP